MNLIPEFFDVFGALAFISITLSALYAIKTKQQLPRWVLFCFAPDRCFRTYCRRNYRFHRLSLKYRVNSILFETKRNSVFFENRVSKYR
jgi:hypothetical protein